MQYPAADLVIDPVLIRKYDASGPRYTSYPTADRFVEAFGAPDLQHCLTRRNVGGITQPLSLYVHLPFCGQLCYYCACTKVLAHDSAVSIQYIKYLEREMALLAPHLDGQRQIAELHWGGGTPTFLAHEEMRALAAALERTFSAAPGCERSIEVDARQAPAGTLAFLGSLGFNRVSFGVQGFELTRAVVAEARASGFRSVSLDLIYGLPRQTLDGFSRTLEQVLDLDPDRIALYSYAHLPQRFPPQRHIADHEIPSAELKLQLMTLAIGRLTRAGYLYIGLDHFVRPEDDLAAAQAQGRLRRSFQGYSTQPGDFLGLGMSAIGKVGAGYYQNEKGLEAYYAALDEGRLPVARGVELTADDLVRGAVIQALTCHFRVSLESIELAHLIDFRRYFAAELADLARLADDGLVELAPDWIVVTPKGRLLVRTVCTVFDRYLRTRSERATYSRLM